MIVDSENNTSCPALTILSNNSLQVQQLPCNESHESLCESSLYLINGIYYIIILLYYILFNIQFLHQIIPVFYFKVVGVNGKNGLHAQWSKQEPECGLVTTHHLLVVVVTALRLELK